MQDIMTPKSPLGRPLDPSYPTNLAILIITPLLGLAAGIYQFALSGSLGDAVLAGLVGGASAFISWGLAREIDPDYDLSAFVAVAFAVIGYLLLRPTTLAVFSIGVLILGLRIVNRIVGYAPKLPESLIVFVATAIGAYVEGWPVALLGAIVFLFDAMLQPQERRHYLFAGLSVIVAIVVAIINQPLEPAPLTQYAGPLVVAGLIFLVTIALTRQITSKTDLTNEAVSVARVRAAMLLALICGFLMVWWHGDHGFVATLPLWASLLAVPVYRVINWIIVKMR